MAERKDEASFWHACLRDVPSDSSEAARVFKSQGVDGCVLSDAKTGAPLRPLGGDVDGRFVGRLDGQLVTGLALVPTATEPFKAVGTWMTTREPKVERRTLAQGAVEAWQYRYRPASKDDPLAFYGLSVIAHSDKPPLHARRTDALEAPNEPVVVVRSAAADSTSTTSTNPFDSLGDVASRTIDSAASDVGSVVGALRNERMRLKEAMDKGMVRYAAPAFEHVNIDGGMWQTRLEVTAVASGARRIFVGSGVNKAAAHEHAAAQALPWVTPHAPTQPPRPSLPQANARTWLNEQTQARRITVTWGEEKNLGDAGWDVTLVVAVLNVNLDSKSFARNGKTKKLAQELAARDAADWAAAQMSL